ncbi:SusC/RagA family TonB-linked outer membrane protein [Hymenobacter yonginensis]|uniref:TonB-dependent receptor n=1 Tax=Hymenobacter yonginensis TaxID=748197 RepID=A0ABY7PR57_9BACT|nr:TonB-dependent receptor [Hymenobacter yonginensis]WBO85332.1 TonB-dependent receptor [Hymenobacter yonginensis]
MSFPLQSPQGNRPFRRLLLTPAVGSLLLTGLAAAQPGAALAYAPTLPAPTAGKDLTAAFNGPVSGRVVDAKGEALPGVTVVVEGTTLGSATDANGNYTIPNVPAGPHTLVISSIGFTTVRLPITVVDGQTTQVAAATLAENTQALNEVVVVGYGTQTRQELTTAVSSVGARQIERQTVAGFDQALQGQTPGVQVTSPSGAPGAGINVRIRGNSSVSLSNSPLYVIDGVPVLPTYNRELGGLSNQSPNPLNALNPSDIESIDVLKDGAAAAIYGVRASNGVVVITTKRGKAGKAQVGLSMYYGQQQLRKKLDVLNARQFAEYYNEALINGGRTAAYPDLNNLPANTDWQDEVYRTAAIQNYQLNVSGGSDKTRYYVSGGYFKQDGIFRNSGFDRFSFRINLDQEVSKRFRIGTNLNLSRTNNNGSVRSERGSGNGGTVLGTITQIPTLPVRNADGTYATNPFNSSFDNPVGNLLETRNKALIYQAIGNIYSELDILDNLQFRSSLGIDFRSQVENEYVTREYPGNRQTSTPDPATLGQARTGTDQQVIWLNENTLTYNLTLGEKSRLTLLAGQSVQASNRFTSNARATGFPSNAVPYLFAGTANRSVSSFESEWALLSAFGRAIYNYDDRYLATVSFRADGSSRFAKNKRFGYFPAVSAGWNISKESFFPQTDAISSLKLRASYGENGNQEIGDYVRFSTYGSGFGYQGNGSISGGIAPERIGNADVSWEVTKQTNLGLDLSLLEDRLTFNADLYRKRSTDLLFEVPLPLSTGAQTLNIIQNLGEVENKGLELGLNTVNVRAEDNGFAWSTNLNFTLNRGKVINIGTVRNEQGQESGRQIINDYNIVRNGSPLGTFYGLKADGIFQTDAEARAQNPNARAGDQRFVDLNGDGRINDQDRTVIGNANPNSIAGVTNTFSFKGLELSVFFQGSFGNDIYNENRRTTEGMSQALNQTTRVLNRWTPTNTNTDVPRAVFGDPAGNNQVSSRFIEDGSYVRLKNLTLAYGLPQSVLQKSGISGVRVYVTGQNLLTWTDYSGYDPEVSADPFSSTGFGRDLGVYPQARTYTVGLNATF